MIRAENPEPRQALSIAPAGQRRGVQPSAPRRIVVDAVA